jgi:hypothetical protein
LHLECEDGDKTEVISIPSTAGFQNWTVVKKSMKLDAGQHVLKLAIDGSLFNLDKMIFQEIK